MTAVRRLVGLAYSPWTVRTRWALEHHRVEYRYSEYLPIFGEPALRMATRRFRGKLTVPVLIDGRTVVGDSLDIARHAESLGSGDGLFGDLEHARHWTTVSERIASAGRLRTTTLVSTNREAKRDSLPKGLGWALPAADLGVRYLTKKYGLDTGSVEQAEEEIGAALEVVAEALDGDYLGDGFSYADMAVATAFQFVDPVDNRYIRLGPHSAACWRVPQLAERFRGLMDWRDRLFANHRRPADSAS